MRTRANFKIVIRCGDAKFIEKGLRHFIVVVLTRVNKKFLMILSEGTADRGSLDKFGARANNRYKPHN